MDKDSDGEPPNTVCEYQCQSTTLIVSSVFNKNGETMRDIITKILRAEIEIKNIEISK
jgi:hypothetical protein